MGEAKLALAAAQARADQEVARHRAMIGELVQAYRKAVADSDVDPVSAMASMTHELAGKDNPSMRAQWLGGALAVAVAMLADAQMRDTERAAKPSTPADPRDVLDQPAVAYDPEDPHRPGGD